MVDKPAGANRAPETIGFHYLKSSLYRTVHADGAYGGMTPRGLIDVSFYSERRPIPNYLVHSITPAGALGPEIRDERISKSGVIRELEVGVIFDLASAKSFLEWFKAQVDELERATQEGKGAEK